MRRRGPVRLLGKFCLGSEILGVGGLQGFGWVVSPGDGLVG